MKQLLRSRFLVKRQKQPFDWQVHKAAKITQSFLKLPEVKKAKRFLLYYGIAGEVRTLELVSRLLAKKKKVALPRISKDNLISPRFISGLHDLETAEYRIPSPKQNCKEAKAEDFDVIVVPGIAFDRELHRIGYGKGYYDKFLKGAKAFKAGLAYDFQVISKLPREDWDVRLDCVVTENRILRR